MADIGDDPARLPIDISKPSSARIYDYFLGGKDNYEVDREAAAKVLEVFPNGRVAARHNRQFIQRAVAELADMGVVQYLDIGTGIPTEPSLHHIAQHENPEARVVYVDNDKMVLAHARALLRSSGEGRTRYVEADLADPRSILDAPELGRTLDLESPVAVSLIAVLHFLNDDQDPYQVVKTLMDAFVPGSFLLLSHATADLNPAMDDAMVRYRESGIYARNRNRAEIAQFFDGLELLEPGIVATSEWRPRLKPPSWLAEQVGCLAGVGRKP
jgi:S-adenosyl methyltransferase